MDERFLLDLDLRRVPLLTSEVLVIGSGVAALSAALAAAETRSVLVVTKDAASESNTYYAQGGVAVSFLEPTAPDRVAAVESHIRDTLEVGAGLCDEQAVRKLVTEGPERVRQLIEWGVKFDLEGTLMAFTREGGHSRRRVMHAKGDATGEAIEVGLLSAARMHKNITILEGYFVVDLLHADRVCYGALAREAASGKYLQLEARATVLATGGMGQVYRETTNPEVATGDGVAMAYRAGANVRDLEFVQFHPTTLYLAGAKRFLISEAVRGEGAYLRNARGERFMPAYDERAELAPRDVVAQAIERECAKTNASSVFLDLSHLDTKLVNRRFPTISGFLAQYGLDVKKDPIPVRPAAHYMMGGVETDLTARTSIQRLFAAGEAACTGVHGANRLASNSLLEGLVFGHEAGGQAAQTAAQKQEPMPERYLEANIDRKEIPLDLDDVRRSLKSLMWRAAGVFRTEEQLRGALKMIEFWNRYVFPGELGSPSGFELQNLLLNAHLICRSALLRLESRGAHCRLDFPETDEENWRRSIVINRERVF